MNTTTENRSETTHHEEYLLMKDIRKKIISSPSFYHTGWEEGGDYALIIRAVSKTLAPRTYADTYDELTKIENLLGFAATGIHNLIDTKLKEYNFI